MLLILSFLLGLRWRRAAGELLLGAAMVAAVSTGGISWAAGSLRQLSASRSTPHSALAAPASTPRLPTSFAMASGAVGAPAKNDKSKGKEAPVSQVLIPGGMLLVVAGAYGLLLWRRPQSLLLIPDDGISLAFMGLPWLKDVKLGAPLARGLKYRPQVLDAWIAARLDRIRERFEALTTVEQRRVFIPLPVMLDGKPLNELTPEIYSRCLGTRELTLICAEGGAGKTSLACAIGRWALEGKLARHRAVPLLIEADLNEGETAMSRITRLLGDLTDGGAQGGGVQPDLSEAMVQALLNKRRLLMILDHYSEFTDTSRDLLKPTRDLSPAGWVVVTSRRNENFKGRAITSIIPQRLASNRLQPFFNDYLNEKKKQQEEQEAFWDDDMLARAQERLRRITEGIVDEQREITVLLAKLYIDTVIAERQEGGGLLPDSVPQLMRTYVDQINRTIEEANRLDGDLVRRSLQWLAKESLGEQLRPRAVARALVLEVLGKAIAELDASADPIRSEKLLGYLRERLQLVESPSGPGLPSDRLQLDPLADYLGAMWWLNELCGTKPDPFMAWQGFLTRLPEPGSEGLALMRGFLRALLDCCEQDGAAGEFLVPKEALELLAQRAGIDREQREQDRQRRRLQRWIDDLAEPEREMQLGAIEQLLKRGSAARAAAPTLARLLANPAQDLQVRSAAALALGGIGGGEASTALLRIAADGEQPVALRRASMEALGLCASGAGQSKENRKEITAALEGQLRRQPLEVVVQEASDWERIDAVLPLLQGAARGLQLAAAADLPLLGSGMDRVVPMLTLTALNKPDGQALEVRTEVLEVPVWKLPLPEEQQLEMVLVPGGEYTIGSPEEREDQQGEAGRDVYPSFRQRCEGVNVEALRTVRLEPTAMVRFPISQAQWGTVAGLPLIERKIAACPGTYEARSLWERYGQPGALAVDSVSWFDCGEWLARLNRWLAEEWATLGGRAAAPQLALPSESQWEVACRAGSSTPFHSGDTLDPSWANYDANYTYGRGRKGEYRQRPTATGALAVVNRWGLAEMHGQLFEWCGDRWHPDPLGSGWRQDGSAWEEPDAALEGLQDQEYRLLRGGSWTIDPHACRAAFRFSFHPGIVYADFGVRPCCLLPPGLPS